MLSWSLGADIEDEERQYFKANVVPEVRLPQPIWLRVLTSLQWTTERRDLHTNVKSDQRGALLAGEISPGL